MPADDPLDSLAAPLALARQAVAAARSEAAGQIGDAAAQASAARLVALGIG